jgi:hypothetical protein
MLNLDDPLLPNEVVNNMCDPEQKQFELVTSLKFQIKHYKTMLSRCVSKMVRDRKEYQRRVAFLEANHGNAAGVGNDE